MKRMTGPDAAGSGKTTATYIEQITSAIHISNIADATQMYGINSAGLVPVGFIELCNLG